MRRDLQALLAATVLALCAPVQATSPVPTVRLSHLFHQYAGGGGCLDHFLLERDTDDQAPALKDLRIELRYERRGQESVPVVIEMAALGAHGMDRWSDLAVETVRCPAQGARLVVRSAVASLDGARVDLLAAHAIRPAAVPATPIRLPPR